MKSLIVSHGRAASGICSTVKMFLGDCNLEYIDAYIDGVDDHWEERVDAFIHNVESEGAYIFTDIFGGSVNQVVMKNVMKSDKHIVIITNINVPTIIDLLVSPKLKSLEEIETQWKQNEVNPKVMDMQNIVNQRKSSNEASLDDFLE